MYCIPTQSEVLDPEYRRSFNIVETQWNLSFFFLFSDCYAHNSTIGIFRGETVDSKTVQEKYIQNAEEFKEKLLEARTKGYLVNRVIKGWSSVHPNIGSAYDCMLEKQVQRIKRRTLDEDLVSVTSMTKAEIEERFKNNNCLVIESVNYSYNPTELAISEVGKYSEALKQTDRCMSLCQLYKIKDVANQFYDNANLGLFEHNLFETFDYPSSIERIAGTEANKLRLKHEEIAKQSNAYLQFDEKYFVVKTNETTLNMLPFASMFNDEEYREFALKHIKKLFNGKLFNRKKELIVNGKPFGEEILEKSPFKLLSQ